MTAIRLAASRTWFVLRVPLLLFGALIAGHRAGDWHWPYNLRSIEVDPEVVRPGGTVGIVSVRDYFDNCTLFYSRKIETVQSPATRSVMLPDEVSPTPWENDLAAGPAHFPCGAEQQRISPLAACNLLQTYV